MNLLDANDRAGEYPKSYYAATATPLAPLPPPKGAQRCDVAIIGAGFTGLSAALHLAQAGFNVRLLEAQRIGFGASGRNGGQVGTGQRRDQDALEKMVGIEDARKLWALSLEAVELVKSLGADMDGVDYRPGIIHAAHRARYVPEEHAYAEKMSRDYGYDLITPLTREELRMRLDSPAYYGGALDMGGGHIHPLNFALGLARKAIAAGAVIHENARVTEILKGNPVRIKTDQAELHCDHLILACNGYLGGLEPNIAARVMPINNFILATEPMEPVAQARLIADDHAVADSKFVVNYFRFSQDHRLLFGGTESYGYRFPKDISGAVRKAMISIFPQLSRTKIDFAWGGTLAITMNRMPCFMALEPNILNASGYSGHGVAMATMGGKIMARAIQGQAEKFDLMSKVPTHLFPGGAHLRSPLLVLAMLWYSLRDRL